MHRTWARLPNKVKLGSAAQTMQRIHAAASDLLYWIESWQRRCPTATANSRIPGLQPGPLFPLMPSSSAKPRSFPIPRVSLWHNFRSIVLSSIVQAATAGKRLMIPIPPTRMDAPPAYQYNLAARARSIHSLKVPHGQCQLDIRTHHDDSRHGRNLSDALDPEPGHGHAQEDLSPRQSRPSGEEITSEP
jgi:hypothetical protein